jgi:hypothetical protein
VARHVCSLRSVLHSQANQIQCQLDLVGLAYEDLGILGSSLPSGRSNAPEWRAMFAACVLKV